MTVRTCPEARAGGRSRMNTTKPEIQSGMCRSLERISRQTVVHGSPGAVLVSLLVALTFAAPLVPGWEASAAESADSVSAAVRAAEQARVELIARITPSVVCIFDEKRGGGGSGVIITSDGCGLTNYHVVAGLLKTRRGLGGLADGERYPLQVLGIDPTGDVAMFRLSGKEEFTAAPLGDSDAVQVGDWVLAMGNPFALAEDYTPTVTQGIVGGVHRYQYGAGGRQLRYTDCIQVDASINPGNSGGPLFNMQGEVIGINGRASFEQRGRVNVGLAYAISVNQIKSFIPGLRAGLMTEHGSLGATVIDLGYRRVVFEEMREFSSAASAGAKVGDRLVGFAGHEIHSANQFASILGTLPAGWPVQIMFERQSEKIARTVRLEALPVEMKTPFEVDQGLNQAEVRRILDRCRASLGRLPAAGALRWEALSIRSPEELQVSVPAARQAVPPASSSRILRCQEPLTGCGRCEILDDAGRCVSACEYDERIVQSRPDAGETAGIEPWYAERLGLWLAIRRAVYLPVDDGDFDRWRHVGADLYDGRVIDLLEYALSDDRRIRIGFDPEALRPVRAFLSRARPDRDQPAVEIELADFRDVNGTVFPHQVHTCVDGRLRAIDTITSCRVEAGE